MSRPTRSSVILVPLLLAVIAAQALAEGNPNSVPIIYTTDLYHPHDDPDDHFDLATLFAIPEFDLRAVVIDTGQRGKDRPGILPVRQMIHVTGRDVPVAAGLIDNIKHQCDPALNRPDPEQAGVKLILDVLRKADKPVTVFTTGSLRDVAAAYNRDRALLKQKVARIYINVGHSAGGPEHNVGLDRHAYVRILGSDLPVYWVPCFGGDGFYSHWHFRQGDVLDAAPLPVQNFFVYCLTRANADQRDPIKSLTDPIDPAVKQKIWDGKRNMWCTGAFLHAAGRCDPTFTFEKVTVHLGNDGKTRITRPGDGLEVMTFHHADPDAYAKAMTDTLRSLLSKAGSAK
ncbi:MAG: nucleoside hydrolase [Phycisphaerae bacterium]|nr:nucleoside hydrolase [Phycisphaerae bacterium]